VTVGSAMAVGSGEPSDEMQASDAALLAHCKAGGLAFRLYTEIANARQPSFPQPPFLDMRDDLEDLDED